MSAWVASVSTHCKPIDSVILSARGLWTPPLHSEDDVLFPLLLPRYNRPNFHRSESLCDMERWAGMGFVRKHWLPHGQNSDARFEPQFRCRFGSRPEGFLSLHSRPWLGTRFPQRGVLSHMCSRFLDNIILPIIAREPFDSYTIQRKTLCILSWNASKMQHRGVWWTRWADSRLDD